MSNKIRQIYFYFSCLLYFLRFKNFAIFIAKRKLPTFKVFDVSAFRKKSILKNSYLENNAHFSNDSLINDARNSKFSIRETPLYLSIFKSLKEKKELNILDIGGGAGNHYFSINHEIGNYFIKKFYICELPLFKELSKKYKFPPLIEFLTLDELIKLEKIEVDIVHISGSLQYFEEYKDLIYRVKKLNPKFIVLSRTPFWENKTKTVLQWIVENSDCVNAAYIFNEKEIDSLFKSNYLKLPNDFGYFDISWVIPFGKFPYGSIVYQSNKLN